MAAITITEITDQATWDNFLLSRPEANFLQSWGWGQFHEALGKTILRRGFYKDGQLIGVMLSIVEAARRGRYLTVTGGPIINFRDNDLVKTFANELREQAGREKCVFVRLRPQLLEDDFSVGLFRQLGFKPAPMHLHAELTNQLDITKTNEELLSAMRKGTRYELRQAEKLGIQVTSTTDASALDGFYDLQLETAKRQKFVPFSKNFLTKQFEIFAGAGQALLYTASYEDKLLAQAFIIFWGHEAVYHYAVSTPEARNYPGAYAIQWAAIAEAKQRGMTRYNFWGVAPHDQPHHRFAGVSVFKRGFGGDDVAYLHAQDLVINKPRYLANLLVENTRRRVRRV